MDGILPLWKPKGMTSHDCVIQIRKMFKTKKVGHTGTLDPEVEGVLPICIGKATKIVPYLMDTTKTYVAEVTLGVATETEDAHGKVIEQADIEKPLTVADIDDTLQSFVGEITQIPPMYSAVKVKGKRLYEYARENKMVERPERQVTIYQITRKEISDDRHVFSFEVVSSKGTYIRTLCVDIGRKLGYPAHMSHLVRTETGAFHKENCVTFDMIERAVLKQKQMDLLVPIGDGLKHLQRITVDALTKQRVLYGQKLPILDQLSTDKPFAIFYENELLAIYQKDQNNPKQIRALRVFN
ncbi:MAG TPA: tRNA pseudouridine(55) synthase TruB [Cerasibacillus sp.]|uniref:tRNA pseudouridine(55) synthase TruB n=1 Tax=Cerasibacillus sp. TaxID=2498711 RepID=UPI002F410532